MTPFFSIVVGFRNRDLGRVKWALDSLASQSLQNFELIFIDYGSDEASAAKTRVLVESYSFSKYHYYNSIGWYWNRSHALNLGIRKAIGHVLLIYDIDLVVENDFLRKIGVLDYHKQFYTFSCFYLPQHFKLGNKQLAKDGIHYEQNYVGLCAVKREHVESIKGFDEYFMVWGGEDDDLYQRLSSINVERQQLQATKYAVFHQWHASQSPGEPSMWYLTMVNYLFSKNRNNANIIRNNEQFSLKEDRPVLKLVSEKSYKAYTRLEFLPEHKLLFFNSFIQGFLQLPHKSIAFLEYELPIDNKPRNSFAKLFKKESYQRNMLSFKSISDYLAYFIGINRQFLSDYYLEETANKVLFICLKNELDYQKN